MRLSLAFSFLFDFLYFCLKTIKNLFTLLSVVFHLFISP